MDASIEALLKRATAARTKRDAFRSLMTDVYAYAMPERDAWSGFGYGQQKTQKVFDSTAVVATARFANRWQQAVMPAQQRFATLTLPPELAAIDEAQPVQVDLEAATDLLFRHIHVSNFDLAVNEFAQDLAAGTACMLIENGRLGTRRNRAPLLRFQAIPSAKVAFDEGPFGNVEGVFFDQELEARLVGRTYPDATLPRELAELATTSPETIVKVLQATTYDPQADEWVMDVILEDKKDRLVKRRFRTSPWIITRWSKAPGEAHGRGPLTQAMPDIRTLNKLMELQLMNVSLQIGGVWTAMDDGVLNPATVRILPGTVIPVRSNGGPLGASLARLTVGSDFTLSDAIRQQLQTAIRQVLFDDPLPPEVQAGLTATEVTERVRRFQQDTGSFGRMQSDCVAPILTRCIDILEQAGELADPRFRDLLELLKDDAIRIRATSPLAQAQDLADVSAVFQFLQAAASLGDLGAQLLRSGINAERAGRYIAGKAGVPQSLIPTEAELREKAEAEQDAQEANAVLTSPAVAQVAGQVARMAGEQGMAPEAAA